MPAFQIESVLQKRTIRKRREALKAIPGGLKNAFRLMLERIKNQEDDVSENAINVLQWVFLSERPLSIKELQHALAVEPGDSQLDRENFPDVNSLLHDCLGLVVIHKGTSILRLVHKSLQDYMQAQYDEGNLFPRGIVTSYAHVYHILDLNPQMIAC